MQRNRWELHSFKFLRKGKRFDAWYYQLNPELCCYCCSVAKLCPTLCDPMNYSTPGFSVLYYLPEGNGTPLQHSCLEKSHGRRSLVGCSPWGCEESDTTKRLPFHFSLSCIGEGNGNPLQVLAWRIPGTGEPGGLLSMGSHRVGHDWSDLAAAAAAFHSFIQSFRDSVN